MGVNVAQATLTHSLRPTSEATRFRRTMRFGDVEGGIRRRKRRRREAHGDVIVVRFADDFALGFEHRHDAERFLTALRDRFTQFGLALHPEKTRLIEFGRLAVPTRRARR